MQSSGESGPPFTSASSGRKASTWCSMTVFAAPLREGLSCPAALRVSAISSKARCGSNTLMQSRRRASFPSM